MGVQGEQEVRRPGPRRRTGGVEADVIEVTSSEEEEPPRPQKAIRSAGAPGKKNGEWRKQEEGRYPCTAPGCNFKGWAEAYRRHQLRVHGVKWLANSDNRMRFRKHNRWTGPGPDYILRNPSGQVDNLAAAMEDAGVSTPEEAQAAGDQQLEELLSHMSSEDDGGSEDGNNTPEEEPTERAEPGGEQGGPVSAENPENRTGGGPEVDKEVVQREPTAAVPEEGERRPRDKACGAGPEEGGQQESTAVEPEERDNRPRGGSGGARPKEASRRESVPRPCTQSAAELTAARAAARERHAAEERHFKEMLARRQEEQENSDLRTRLKAMQETIDGLTAKNASLLAEEQPDKGEPAKKEPNPTKKRKVLASEESQVHSEVVSRHTFGNENTEGTPECPTRKESSATPILETVGTPRRTPGLPQGESGITGGRGGNGHGQVPLSFQERVRRDMTVRAVDGTGASTTESSASVPRARACPECEYGTPREDNLKRHILARHTEGENARRIRESPGKWQAPRMRPMRRETKSKTPRGTKKNKKGTKVWVPLPPAPPEN